MHLRHWIVFKDQEEVDGMVNGYLTENNIDVLHLFLGIGEERERQQWYHAKNWKSEYILIQKTSLIHSLTVDLGVNHVIIYMGYQTNEWQKELYSIEMWVF